MKRNVLLKLLIVLVLAIIVTIIIILNFIKKNNEKENINGITNSIEEKNIDNSNINQNISDELDISEIWHQFDDLSYYKTTLSFEIYIKKYIEKNELINNFSGFNINDVWSYKTIQNEQNINEYYIDGYAYNSDFSDIKEIVSKFTLDENNGFKIEKIDLTNTTWDNILNSKVQEIKNNWETIKKQFEVEEPIEEEDDENIIDNEEEIDDDDENIESVVEIEEPKPIYNENEFVVLDITDKDLINRYFTNYKIKVLTNKQEAYNLLHKDTKNALFKSFDEFDSNIKNYLNNNTTINKIKVVRSIVDENGYTNKLVQYIIADKNDNMFGIEITGINDYTVAVTKK